MSDGASLSDHVEWALATQPAFTNLPPELILVVIEHLSVFHALQLARASRHIYELVATHAYARHIETALHNGNPLVWAVKNDLLKTAERALALGVDANEPFRQGHAYKFYTPLLVAIEHKNVAMVSLLLRYGAHPAASTSSDTPLMMAVSQKSPEIVQLLLKQDQHHIGNNTASPYRRSQLVSDAANVRGVQGHTALYYAVLQNDTTMVDLLLSHNAKPDLLNAFGQAPLATAIMHGKLEIVKRLLDSSKAYVVTRDDGRDNGFSLAATLVRHASAGVSMEILKAVLYSVKRVTNGKTWFVVPDEVLQRQLGRDRHMMKLLLDAGVDPDVKSAAGATVL
ncbi:ankyrin repeat-containing domain protein [Microdochium trichocladiopsis]|uniref:Ankyrin repeat-containing domain protein n=1 Tax=Microdochium trichocladiopsis TaxID=1682393 RepID=A0A9P8Y062_9PEZI|nr:ankyrin repeat-containing domain protein [Microdochium trichocladiopsis]KAH7027358.1 ankyrin repeat-containing domain protein [Microdochium trichocladiopsis]